jgi:mono/diheme cytochrome c family protein
VFREKLLHIALGAILAVALLVPLFALLFVKSGVYDVAASRPHTKFTEWLTHETMIHSVRSHAKGIVAPSTASSDAISRGFCTYQTHCVACHGAAAVAREHWVSGQEPQPPYLVDATHIWKPREMFWIVKNGIKMTGMPAWRDSLSDRDVWDVVAWLKASSQLSPQTYVRWRSERRCGGFKGPWPAPEPPPIPRP